MKSYKKKLPLDKTGKMCYNKQAMRKPYINHIIYYNVIILKRLKEQDKNIKIKDIYTKKYLTKIEKYGIIRERKEF